MPPVLRCLVGPTASGKGRVGRAVAHRIGAEILSLDSMKVYTGMDLGTAKPDAAARRDVEHHLLDLVEPHESYNVSRYLADAARACTDIAARGKRLLFVGGLTPPKRLDTLLQAMAQVVRVCPKTELRIVGDGEDRPRWEALAGDLGITGQVTFAGALPHEDIPAEMRSASVLVHCSDHEGLPSAIMEALMCGLPVVATRVGGIPDLIQDGGNGFLVDPERPDETAERLVTILSNPDLIARMSRAALAFARAHLDKEIVMDQIEELYRTVL